MAADFRSQPLHDYDRKSKSMKENCIIKSGSYGITLLLNPSSPIEDTLREICYKFASQKKFFGSAKMVLTVTGRQLTDEEFEAVIQSIEYNSDVKIDLIYDKSQIRDRRMRSMRDRFYFESIRQNCKIVLGPVKDGQKVQSDASLLILGDAEEGSELLAAGNIIVTGLLAGDAKAGCPDHEDCFVYAGDLNAEAVHISGHDADLPERKSGFLDRFRKKEGQILLRHQNRFLLTNVYDELLTELFQAEKKN